MKKVVGLVMRHNENNLCFEVLILTTIYMYST